MRRKVAELELELEILNSRGLLRAGDGRRAAVWSASFIAAGKTAYGVRRLCRVFGISPTTFYACAARAGGPSAAELDEAYAVQAARDAWSEHRRV